MNITMQHMPNIRVMPGREEASFSDLVADVKKGVAVLDLAVSMDQQRLNGVGYPVMRQILNGKLGTYIVGGGIMFRAPELWKNLIALGGPASERWYGLGHEKGEPKQFTTHSVGAVPGVMKNVRVFDAMRKA